MLNVVIKSDYSDNIQVDLMYQFLELSECENL